MTHDLWKALAYLYPAADPRRDYELRDDGDGLGPYVYRMSIGPMPTKTEIDAAIAAYDAREQQRQADTQALRQRVITTAQSAVGVAFDQLTNVQLRAVLGCLLHQRGVLDKDGKVRPLGEWL